MANVKLVVMYPRPKDVDTFEKVYRDEHVPLAVAKLSGKTKIGCDQGTRFPARSCSFPPDRGSLISHRLTPWKHARCLKAAKKRCSRGEDFFRRAANFS